MKNATASSNKVLRSAWQLTIKSLMAAKTPEEAQRLAGELAGIEAQMRAAM